MGKAVLGFLKERVGENDPYFRYFAYCKVFCNMSYLGAKETHVGQRLIQGYLSAVIDTVALHIHTYKIPVLVLATQAHAVFSFSAGQFQGYRIIIAEYFAPLALYILRLFQHIRKSFDRIEPDQFFMPHSGRKDIATFIAKLKSLQNRLFITANSRFVQKQDYFPF